MMSAQGLGAIDLLSRGRRGVDRYGWRALCTEISMRGVRPALAPLAARRLQAQARQRDEIDQLVELMFDFDAFGITIRPLQSRWEFRRLVEEVARVRPRAMLEIGTARGGSLFAFARACANDAHVLSVDLPHGAFGGGYPRWRIPLYRSFAGPSQRLDLIRADSHDPATFAEVKARLGGRPLDFLFIDGDHTYAGVRADFERYRTLVRPGGLVGFHDIAPPRQGTAPVGDVGEVPRYWAELTARHDVRELVDPDGQGCFGIGLLAVPC